jgi:DNA mismatch endonuclease (patch repair protein)
VRTTPSYVGLTPSSAAASKAKRANRREGGRAERLLGRAMWARGLRYRKHDAGLPGKPDFVFRGARLCVFVDGDFWHGRNWDRLRERLAARANPDYWIAKVGRNIERDAGQTLALRRLGWEVWRCWETDVLADPDGIASRVRQVLEDRRRTGAPSLC